jgi:thioredoxin-dependent peroxiredoxin
MELKKAPDFALPDEEGKTLSIKDYRGKALVLFFFPKANTSGWTAEASGFRDAYSKFQKAGAEVLGVSPDKPAAQKKFKEEFGFPFHLLSDVDKSVAKSFGVLKEKSMYGKKFMGIERTTFVIGGDGRIAAAISGIKADEHPQAALEAVKRIGWSGDRSQSTGHSRNRQTTATAKPFDPRICANRREWKEARHLSIQQ